jgi:signal transduction histidine kinase
MMHEFLTAYRADLIERCRQKVALRLPAGDAQEGLEDGVSQFIDQLIKTLQMEQTSEPRRSRRVSGPADGTTAPSEIAETAARHGRELLKHGYTIDQVVHDYGDLCQAIADMAFERTFAIETDEFRTLNRCLDNAIAGAVTEYNHQRDLITATQQADSVNERLGCFAHDLRNLLSGATLALAAIKAGTVGLTGATGMVLDRSLVGLRNLIDRSLSEVRLSEGLPTQHQVFPLADFIEEVKLSGALEAHLTECELNVSHVDSQLAVDADREMLLAAVGNLLQNAFKFTHHHSEVTLSAYAVADQVLIEVQDHCGGLPGGDADKIFVPFTQNSENKTGLGLGLSISRRAVEANDGTLTVRDMPGDGCVFTIALPRYSMGKSTTTDPLVEKLERMGSLWDREGKSLEKSPLHN